MIALRFAGHDFQLAGIVARIDPGMRVGGTVGSPNNAAAFLQMLLVPALCISLSRLRWGYRWLAFVAFALGSIALVLTFSRGGWLSFLASLTIFCLLAWQRGWLSRSFVFTLAGLAMVLSLIFLNTFISRLFGDDAGAAYSRIPLMKLAFRMIADFPLLGVGANNFIVMIERYAKGELAWAWLYLVHNKYLLIAAETGICALAAFIWFLLSTLRRGWLCTKTNDSLLAPIALAFVAAIVGNMVHMLVDILHSRPAVQQLWLAAGLIAAMYSISCQEKSLGKSGEYSRYHTVQERGELRVK